MNLYFAPMEGITGYLFRNAHHDFYPGLSKYFIPYVEPHEKRAFNSREKNDISPENNKGMHAIPQILTKDAEGFLRMSRFLVEQGNFKEINLNLGCPSGTVVSKGKGAGFLGYTDELHFFLEKIFQDAPCDISIKTRIGRFQPDEFEELLEMYNEYPIKELIIHPRTREDYYKYPIRPESYRYAVNHTSLPLCFNGNIFTVEDFQKRQSDFPETDTWMLGRGLLMNPQLAEMITCQSAFDLKRFILFHNRIYSDYGIAMPGNQHLLMKMKELWSYWILIFPENKKLEKQLKKVRSRSEYEIVVKAIFDTYQ